MLPASGFLLYYQFDMNKAYFPHLDGLRFFAFLAVLISHLSLFTGFTGYPFNIFPALFLTHGDLGVAFFFTLSGFLITYLLLQEREQQGSVSLKHFYIRRALRIWPVYVVVILCGFFIFPNLIDIPLALSLEAPLSRLPAYIFFLGNIDLVYMGYASVIIGVLWSLAVEEQFYLIWPAVFKKIKLSRIPWVLGGVIIWSWIYRFAHWENYEIVHYMTLSVFSDLAIGCLLAYVAYFNKGFVTFFEKLPSWAIAINYIVISVYIVLRVVVPFMFSPTINRTLYSLESIIFCILFSVVIMEQCFGKHSLFKMAHSHVFTYLGKISYGLYAYHMIALTIVLWFGVVFFGLPLQYSSVISFGFIGASTFVLSVFFAYVSYVYMEKPILKLKDRVGYVK